MAGEDERHLRERLTRLRGLPLLRGTRLSGDANRLQKQLERMEDEPSDQEIWRSVDLARHSQRPYTLDYVSGSSRTSSSCTEIALVPRTRRS